VADLRRRTATEYLLPHRKSRYSTAGPAVPATGLKKMLHVVLATVFCLGFLAVLLYTLLCDSGLILLGYRRGAEALGVLFVIAFPVMVIWGERDKKKKRIQQQAKSQDRSLPST